MSPDSHAAALGRMHSLGIDQLSVDDRLALVCVIWDSVAAEASARPLSDAKRRDLDRRLAELDANPDDVVAWEEVDDEMSRRYSP